MVRPFSAVLLALPFGLALVPACTAASSSRPLSGEPPRPLASGIYLSTRPPAAPHRTVGFVQITAHGSTLQGLDGVSDTELDPAIQGLLARAVHDAGAEGAVVVDFADVLPPRPATRPWSAVRGAPPGRVDTRARWLEVHAELFVFDRGGGRAPAGGGDPGP